MKRIIIFLLILLTVLSVACQPKAKVVPTPDIVKSVSNQGASAILYVNNSNINKTSNIKINSTNKNNGS